MKFKKTIFLSLIFVYLFSFSLFPAIAQAKTKTPSKKVKKSVVEKIDDATFYDEWYTDGSREITVDYGNNKKSILTYNPVTKEIVCDGKKVDYKETVTTVLNTDKSIDTVSLNTTPTWRYSNTVSQTYSPAWMILGNLCAVVALALAISASNAKTKSVDRYTLATTGTVIATLGTILANTLPNYSTTCNKYYDIYDENYWRFDIYNYLCGNMFAYEVAYEYL